MAWQCDYTLLTCFHCQQCQCQKVNRDIVQIAYYKIQDTYPSQLVQLSVITEEKTLILAYWLRHCLLSILRVNNDTSKCENITNAHSTFIIFLCFMVKEQDLFSLFCRLTVFIKESIMLTYLTEEALQIRHVFQINCPTVLVQMTPTCGQWCTKYPGIRQKTCVSFQFLAVGVDTQHV